MSVFERNWRHYLLKTRAKRQKNWQNNLEWFNKLFRNASKPWEWFRSKEIEFSTIIPSAENHGECPDMPPRRRPDRMFTVPRLCSAFGRWVLNGIDKFKPSIERGTTTVPREIRYNYPPAWQYSDNIHLEMLKWEVFIIFKNVNTLSIFSPLNFGCHNLQFCRTCRNIILCFINFVSSNIVTEENLKLVIFLWSRVGFKLV